MICTSFSTIWLMMERLKELERAKVVSKVRKMTRNVTTPLYLRNLGSFSLAMTETLFFSVEQNNKSCSRLRPSTFLEVEYTGVYLEL